MNGPNQVYVIFCEVDGMVTTHDTRDKDINLLTPFSEKVHFYVLPHLSIYFATIRIVTDEYRPLFSR